MATEDSIALPGRVVRVTNLERVLWPEAGFTKGDMLRYYKAVSSFMLPHIRDRAMVLSRHPSGVEGDWWFQTQCPHPPPWVRTIPIPKATDPDAHFEYCVIDNVASLLWAANLSAIEFHPLLSRTASLGQPTSLVLDLDPGPRVGFDGCARVALSIGEHLAGRGLNSYAKTTGSTGIHIHVPLNTSTNFDEAKAFARDVARATTAAHPALVTDRTSRKERMSKVLVDWAQNNPLRSVVAPYSLRALPFPSVATPVTWTEIEKAAVGRGESLVLHPEDILKRVDAVGDPLDQVQTERQALPSL